MSTDIPTKMKRLVVMTPAENIADCKIEVQEVDVPKPAAGEVLIKVAAAAINPSDYGSWTRTKPENCPFAMGNEGSGVVVALGSGFATGFACPVGTKVGFIGLKHKQGAYSEYVVAAAVGSVFPMAEDLPIEDAASFFVNPYTAIGIFDTARRAGAKALVHTAAASQLGQMMVKLSNDESEGMQVINVVRREEQAKLLKDLGAKHVVVTGDDEEAWKKELTDKISELGATVAFDAVAGRSTGDILDCLPKKGSVYVYGGLAGKVCNVDPMALIYHDKKIKSFYLTNWVKDGSTLGMIWRMRSASTKVNAGLKKGGWSSSQFKDTTLENAHADISMLLGTKITGQKLRVRFDSATTTPESETK